MLPQAFNLRVYPTKQFSVVSFDPRSETLWQLGTWHRKYFKRKYENVRILIQFSFDFTIFNCLIIWQWMCWNEETNEIWDYVKGFNSFCFHNRFSRGQNEVSKRRLNSNWINLEGVSIDEKKYITRIFVSKTKWIVKHNNWNKMKEDHEKWELQFINIRKQWNFIH